MENSAKTESSTEIKPKNKSNLKLVIFGVIGAVAVVIVSLGLTLLATKSDKQIPIFSKLANRIEKSVWNGNSNYRKNTFEKIANDAEKELLATEGENLNLDSISKLSAEDQDSKANHVSYKIEIYQESSKEVFADNVNVVLEDADEPESIAKTKVEIEGYIGVAEKDNQITSTNEFTVKTDQFGSTQKAEGEVRMYNSILYVKLDELGALEQYADGALGRWLSLDLGKIIDEASDEQIDTEIDEDYIKSVKELITSPVIASNLKLTDDKTFDGKVNRCFEFIADESDIEKLDEQLQELFETEVSENDSTSDTIKLLKIDFCLSRNEALLYYFSMSSKSDTVQSKTTINFSKYGEVQKVEKPDFSDFIEDLLTGMIDPTTPNGEKPYGILEFTTFDIPAETPGLETIKKGDTVLVMIGNNTEPFTDRHNKSTHLTLNREYIENDKIKFLYIPAPNFFDRSDENTNFIQSAYCVNEIAGYEEFIKYITQYNSNSSSQVTPDSKLGVDAKKFTECAKGSNYKEKTDLIWEELTNKYVNVSGVPTFYIGIVTDENTLDGQFIEGAYPAETFKESIEYQFLRTR